MSTKEKKEMILETNIINLLPCCYCLGIGVADDFGCYVTLCYVTLLSSEEVER